MPERERFGDYLLHERLAVGGMGELYLATRAERRSAPFALKIMARSYRENPEFLDMFRDEARIGMRLSHSNIVGVHEVGTVEETAFIVMEYVHGENLRSVLRALDRLGEQLAPPLAVKLAIDVLRGLDHAHRATDEAGQPLNLVHRDLSPENILVSYRGDVKLLDFGIAKAEGRTTTTQIGVVKGKPQYMSPEQAKAKVVDARSDLFSAAVVLRELLTGARRFPDDEGRWDSARNWSPRSVPELPRELDSILLRALEPEPSRRFQSADELAAELTRVARSGALPRAKESLPALLTRLFPVASTRKFDASDVTLLHPPRWSSEGTPADRAAPNLATSSSATIPMGPSLPVGAIDTGLAKETADAALAAATTVAVPPPVDDDPTSPAADLAWMRGPRARPTPPSETAPRPQHRRIVLALGILAILGAVSALGAFALWRFRAAEAVPTPEPAATPRAIRHKPPRPPKKKVTPVPRGN